MNGAPVIVGSYGILTREERECLWERLVAGGGASNSLEQHVAFMNSVSGSPLFAGNKVTLLIDRPGIYAAMLQAVAGARDHINVETFSFTDDEFGRRLADALLKKRAEGVEVNLIYDTIGSWRAPPAFFERLKAGGIQVLEFNPLLPLKKRGFWAPLHRDHRKILIIDGKAAVVGSANIGLTHFIYSSGEDLAESDSVPYRDTAVLIEGPAVSELQRLFLKTWRSQCGPVLPPRSYFPFLGEAGNSLVQITGSTAGTWNRETYLMYLSMLTYARRSVHLTNAYFAPDRQLVNALCDASERGVDVRVILSGTSDHRMVQRAGKFSYARLLRSGVKIYELRSSLLHAKTAVMDGVLSTVGSANLDMWSASRNDEVNAVVLDPRFASRLEAVFEKDLEKSRRISPEEWDDRALGSRLGEWFSHLLLPWL